MLVFQDLPIKKIPLSQLPVAFRLTTVPGAWKWNTYIYCGDVKNGGNEPYCFPEEKQCSGHYCKVLNPAKIYRDALVIRDDNTMWKVSFDPFVEVYKLEIYDDTQKTA